MGSVENGGASQAILRQSTSICSRSHRILGDHCSSFRCGILSSRAGVGGNAAVVRGHFIPGGAVHSVPSDLLALSLLKQ